MIRLATIEEVRPGMKIHIMSKVLTVHAPAYFWDGDVQGKGFICGRDDSKKTAETVIVYRGERIAIE